MALILADRVKETTTSTGTGTINLAGAETGFQTFVAGIGNSNTTYYAIIDDSSGDFEVGIGTVTDASPDTLSRDTILQSSNSDSAVNFGSGTKSVFCTQPADKAVFEDADGHVSLPDNAKIMLGNKNGGDLALRHNGTHGQIQNFTNDLQITNFTNDKDVRILSDNGSGGTADYFRADGSSGETKLYHYGSEKIKTQSGGVDVTGDITVSGNVDGRDVAADGTKLDGIEASADVTDATNVTAAGALMDSEVTNLAQVKAFDSSDYATAAQGTTADNALPKAGGTMTGALTTGSAITLNGAQTGGYPSLNLESGSSSVSYINMGTSTDADEGQIAYSPNSNTMTFKAGTATSFQANNTGIKFLDDDRLQIGTDDDFDIYHTAYDNKNYLEASNGEVNVGRGPFGSGQCKLVVHRSGGGSAGGSVIELNSHPSTGQEQVINAAQSAVDFDLQHNGSNKITLNTSGVTFHDSYTFPTSDGSANQVLQTDGNGALSFATVSGGGGSSGQTLIAQGTVSSSTALEINSSVLTGYDQYRIELTNVQGTSDAPDLRMRFGTANSADAVSGRYAYGSRYAGRYASGAYRFSAGNSWFTGGATSAYFNITGSYARMGVSTGETLSTTVYLPNPNSTTKYKLARADTVVYSYYPMILASEAGAFVYNQTSALNFVSFYLSAGSISATYRVYGIS